MKSKYLEKIEAALESVGISWNQVMVAINNDCGHEQQIVSDKLFGMEDRDRSPSEFIRRTFVWRDSKEGLQFWLKVWKKLELLED